MEAEASSCAPITFSIRDIIRTLFAEGLIKIIYWEEILINLKPIIIDQKTPVVNLYLILYNAVIDFLTNEASQVKILKEKQRDLTIEELLDYFVNHIPNDQLDCQTIDLEVVRIFKELTKNEYKTLYEVKKNSECSSGSDDDDNDDYNDDIFEKEFSAILKPKKDKKIKNDKFEQSFNFKTNDETKFLKTPGEKGQYLVEIKIWDTKDIRKTPSDQWWRRINKKVRFLLSSSSDPLFSATNNILKLGFDRIKKIKNLTSGAYNNSNNRFKPY